MTPADVLRGARRRLRGARRRAELEALPRVVREAESVVRREADGLDPVLRRSLELLARRAGA